MQMQKRRVCPQVQLRNYRNSKFSSICERGIRRSRSGYSSECSCCKCLQQLISLHCQAMRLLSCVLFCSYLLTCAHILGCRKCKQSLCILCEAEGHFLSPAYLKCSSKHAVLVIPQNSALYMCYAWLQEGVGDVATAAAAARHSHAAPQRRPSNLHVRSTSMAGDLHTSEHTKKDAKEVRPSTAFMQ